MTAFWIVAALLTVAACLAVAWPFLRQSRTDSDAAHDLEVYRDQLAEVDRDLARGAISPADAEEAKAEIGRRILRSAEIEPASANVGGTRARVTASVALFTVPVVALGLYLVLGSPWMPDQALEARLAANPAGNSIDELIARAERHLIDNPEDGRGWDVLAPIYMRVGRNEDAVIAFRNAIRLNGAGAQRESGLGDAIFRASGNIVTAEAQTAFERALNDDPTDAKARFFLALALAQQGDVDRAAHRWEEMLGDLPEDSPWRGAAAQALARNQERAPELAEGAPGPTADDMQAAAEMSSEDRNAMIEGMVAQLDQRLRDNPDDAAGWRRLIRSFVVLGRADEARAALERGLEGLGSETSEGRLLVEFAADLDVELTESQ
ncbi:MAG: c-type cytochrome biogenesis protein CcmI [Rhizobiaceae bacterium]